MPETLSILMEDFTIPENDTLPINRYHAAGGVVVWKEKVLVLYRHLQNDFRLPKGHIEPAETALSAAMREIGEESGYIDLQMIADLGTEQVEFEKNGKLVIRNEHYFLMKVQGDPKQIEHESDRHPMWFGWDETFNLLSFDMEKEWVRRARTLTDAQSSVKEHIR